MDNILRGSTFAEDITMGAAQYPAGSIDDVDIATAANIDGEKIQHVDRFHYHDDGTVATATKYFGPARKAGTLLDLEAVCETAPTGADTVTIDLQKASDGSTSFSTVLSSTLVLNSSSVDGTLQTATINTTTFADGDRFKLTITVSGTTAQNLTLAITSKENTV